MSTKFITQCIAKGLCFIFLLFCSFQSNASHFYGGQLTWKQDGGNKIKFTFTSTWRRSFYGSPTVGTTINLGSFITGNSVSLSLTPTITAVDVANDQIFTTWEGTHTYTTTGNFTAGWSLCCRLSSLLDGNNDQNASLFTTVNVGTPFNNSPVVSLPAIVYLSIGQAAATFSVAGNDPDGNNLTYRLATQAESGLVTASPVGLTLSTAGLVTFNTTGKTGGERYSLQIMVEDGLTKVPVDIFIQMVGSSQPPVFVHPTPMHPGNDFTVAIGTLLNFTVSATDPENQAVTLNPISVPSGVTHSPALPVTGAVGGAATTTFSWTPTLSQVGSYVLTYVAVDNIGVQTLTSINITVPCALNTVITPTPASCALNDGGASATVTNSSAPGNLVYTWTGPGGFTSAATSISSQPPGAYTLRVNDNSTGCFTLANFTIGSPAFCCTGPNYTFTGLVSDDPTIVGNWADSCIPTFSNANEVITINATAIFRAQNTAIAGSIINNGTIKGGLNLMGQMTNNGVISPGN
jgi:hypothetical protein